MGGFAALKVFDFLVGGDGGGLAVDDLWCHNGGTDVSAVQMPQRKFDGQPHGAMGDLLHFRSTTVMEGVDLAKNWGREVQVLMICTSLPTL